MNEINVGARIKLFARNPGEPKRWGVYASPGHDRVDIVPLSDQVMHTLGETVCVCGPRVEYEPTKAGDAWIVVHHALDGRANA